MRPFWRRLSLVAALAAFGACSGGGGEGVASGGPPPPEGRLVDLTWAPNRERGVNSPGGGYRVTISGKGTIDVPYEAGDLAPTSVSTTLGTGTYTFTVRAYAALDAAGGTAGTESAPSQAMTVIVP